MKIKLTGIYVEDQERALRFYTEVLPYALQYADGAPQPPSSPAPVGGQADRLAVA